MDFYFVLDRTFVHCVYATNLFSSLFPLRHTLSLVRPLHLLLPPGPWNSFTEVVHLLTTSGITHTTQQRGFIVMAVGLAWLQFSSVGCLCFIASASSCKSFVMQSLHISITHIVRDHLALSLPMLKIKGCRLKKH